MSKLKPMKKPVTKEFKGEILEEIGRAKKQGFEISSLNDVLKQLIYPINNKIDLKNTHIDTNNFFLINENEIKIIQNSNRFYNQHIKIIKKHKIKNSHLLLHENKEEAKQIYDSIEGVVLDRNYLKLNQPLTKQELKKHPIMKYTTQNKKILNKGIDYIFSEIAKKHEEKTKTNENYKHQTQFHIYKIRKSTKTPETSGIYIAEPEKYIYIINMNIESINEGYIFNLLKPINCEEGRIIGINKEKYHKQIEKQQAIEKDKERRIEKYVKFISKLNKKGKSQ